MKWINGNTEWFTSVECVNTRKGIYYVNMSPNLIQSEDESVNMRYINYRMENIPTTAELKEMLVSILMQYDSSDEVNGFKVGTKIVWLDKSTRLGLLNSLSIQKNIGQEEATLWLNGEPFTVNIDQALQFLTSLELYAIQCYNNTLEHLREIANLQNREDILRYDVTTGYPGLLTF